MARTGTRFPVAERWAERGRRSDAWAATRDAILEVDASNLAYPPYFDRAAGARVWDVDGNEYLDFNLGYGPVVLGHADERVNDAVMRQMSRGVCASPLWHPLQVELTELLTEVIPGAEQAYLLRTGSDATTAALRLARIHTGRDMVAHWGYNGWHDWCAPRSEGIPAPTLAETVKFGYNDISSLEKLFAAHPGRIACVIMMSYEYDEPVDGFLQQVKEVCHRNGSLFILDEMRSGFRIALGGAQDYFGVRPDLSTFSKAMSNGYPISAVVGRADVLAGLGRTHMSSTFFGNAAEMAAAIATIEVLRETDSLARIRDMGVRFVAGLRSVVEESGLPAAVVGLPVSPFIVFEDTPKAGEAKVAFFTETLRHGILLHPNHQWYLSAAHTNDDVDVAIEACRCAAAVATDGAVRRN